MSAGKSIMTLSQMKSRLILAHQLDYLCIVCGNPLLIVGCMTYEHLRPRSLFKQGTPHTFNRAISHWRCNNLRGNVSLIIADSIVKRKIDQITATSNKEAAIGNQVDYELEMCDDGRKVLAFDSQLQLELVDPVPVVKPVYVKSPMTELELRVWSAVFALNASRMFADIAVKELRRLQAKDPTAGVAC